MKTYASIQAMRGVATVCVAVIHICGMKPGMGMDWFVAPALRIFPMSVDTFFVISGFIMTIRTPLEESARWVAPLRFALDRSTRVYPLYWLVFACAVVASAWPSVQMGTPVPGRMTSPAFSSIMLFTADTYFVQPAWTLAFEMGFYATVVACLAVAPKRLTALAAIGLVVLAATCNVLFIEFAFGVGISFLVRRNALLNGWLSLSLVAPFALAGIILSANEQINGISRVSTYGCAGFFLVYSLVAMEIRGLRFPRTLQFLGGASYSIYMWHWLIAAILAASDPFNFLPPQARVAGWIGVCFAAGIASYELLEKPLLARTRLFVKKLLGAPQMTSPSPVIPAQIAGLG